jgi:formiminotetrahydrofolate cyclodeaminase
VTGLETFLEKLASATPTPGGGAAAALTGATSAALVAMVCRITARHEPAAGALAETERRAEGLRARLTALVQEDTDAFAALLAARRAPAVERPALVRAALARATAVPQEIAQRSAAILVLCDGLAASARASAVSDLGVAVALAAAALEGAALTARVNLGALDDAALAARTRADLAALEGEAAAARRRLAEVVAARTGIPA